MKERKSEGERERDTNSEGDREGEEEWRKGRGKLMNRERRGEGNKY